MIDLNPTILTVTLNVNGLNTKIKWQKIPDWINCFSKRTYQKFLMINILLWSIIPTMFGIFYNSSEIETYPSAIEAIDKLETQSEIKSEKISDLFTAYSFDDMQMIWRPMWFIENESGNILTVSIQPEVIQ